MGEDGQPGSAGSGGPIVLNLTPTLSVDPTAQRAQDGSVHLQLNCKNMLKRRKTGSFNLIFSFNEKQYLKFLAEVRLKFQHSQLESRGFCKKVL